MHRYLLAVVSAALLAAACGGSDAPETETVRFETGDGVELEGRTFGSGEVAVVLSHMGRGGDSQVDWYPLARELSARGYRALTYNRRGVCGESGCSRGVDELSQSWQDVLGAARFVRSEGASRVVLVGASIGAMSSLFAAARSDVEVDGLVEVGGINGASGYSLSRRDLARIEGAKLFVSSAGDSYGGADSARQWHRWARAPKELVILAGSDHGTDMLRPGNPARSRLIGAVVDFLRRYVPAS